MPSMFDFPDFQSNARFSIAKGHAHLLLHPLQKSICVKLHKFYQPFLFFSFFSSGRIFPFKEKTETFSRENKIRQISGIYSRDIKWNWKSDFWHILNFSFRLECVKITLCRHRVWNMFCFDVRALNLFEIVYWKLFSLKKRGNEPFSVLNSAWWKWAFMFCLSKFSFCVYRFWHGTNSFFNSENWKTEKVPKAENES